MVADRQNMDQIFAVTNDLSPALAELSENAAIIKLSQQQTRIQDTADGITATPRRYYRIDGAG